MDNKRGGIYSVRGPTGDNVMTRVGSRVHPAGRMRRAGNRGTGDGQRPGVAAGLGAWQGETM